MVLQAPRRGSFDWGLLLAAAALVGLGLLMLYSATAFDERGPFWKQIWWVGAALVVFLLAVGPPYHLWASVALPIYLATLALLGLVLVAGHEVRGSNSWINVGPANFQPAEAAKVATALMLASFAAEKQGFGLTLRDALGMIAIVAAPVGLILLQPDLGSTLVFFPLLGVMMFIRGLRWRVLVVALLAVLVAIPLVWPHLKPYQKERVVTFFHPEHDPRGSGWQVLQSQIAVGSGGLVGKGLGSGSQGQLNFLPDRHTDFIFAVLAEELGFAGAAAGLILYAVILYGCIETARAARDRLGLYLCMGVAALLGSQILINIGVILGWMPTAGIPLPFMSYGGSSMVTCVAALGLVLNVRMRCLVN